MSKLALTGISILGAFGLLATAVVISVAPDIRRYIKISRM